MAEFNTNTKDLLEQSPLDNIIGPFGGPYDAGVVLSERRHIGKIILRGETDDRSFMSQVKASVGIFPVKRPNTIAETDEITLVWLSPNEWLITTKPKVEAYVFDTLSTNLAKVQHAIVNVSDHSTIIRLSGVNARLVLMKGCSIDLHPRVFHPGCSAQTRLSSVFITFWQVNEAPSYDILIRSSFANHLWNWILDAGTEFRIRIKE